MSGRRLSETCTVIARGPRVAPAAGSLVLLGLVAATAFAAPGDMDPTFGVNGVASIGFGHHFDRGTAVALHPNGTLVMAGHISNGTSNPAFGDLLLVRYDTNDVLDPSFGAGGKVRTPMPGLGAVVNAVAIQPDGKIVVAGRTSNQGDALVVRCHPDGSLDTTFDGDGVVTSNWGGTDDARGVAIQADGKIVIAGSSRVGTSIWAVVARYDANGTPDATFDGDGVILPTGGEAFAVVIQPDGKIVAAGASSQGKPLVLRHNTNGSLDTSFDGDGIAVATIPGAASAAANAVALQGTQIVIAGYANLSSDYDFAVARYNANGTLDATFSGDGMVTVPVEFGTGNLDVANAVVVQANSITVAGTTRIGGANDFAVVQFTLQGVLNISFNGTGRRVTPVGTGNDWATSMVAQSGKFIVAGTATTSTNEDFAIVRYTSVGALDTSFDGDGIRTQDVADIDTQLYEVAFQPDGRIVAVGSCHTSTTTVAAAIVRLDANGALDPTFGSDGRMVHVMDRGATAVAFQPDGKLVVAGNHAFSMAVLRLNPDGSLDPTFAGDGSVHTPIGTDDRADGVLIQPDGKIVLAGRADLGGHAQFALIRHNPDGSLDASFGGDGIVTTSIAGEDAAAHDVKIQSDGRIIAAGPAMVAGQWDFALVRYLANGSLDHTFGSFGRVTTDFAGGATDQNTAMQIQPDGRIVTVGITITGPTWDAALARYDVHGALDPSFDGDGKVTTAIGVEDDAAAAVALRPDGKLMVGIQTEVGSIWEFASARYDAAGALDAGYGIGGKALHDFSPGEALGGALVLDGAGRTLMGGRSDKSFTIIRLLGDATVDVPVDPVAGRPSGIRLVAPNPAAGPQVFVVDVAPGADAGSLGIFNVAGQRVWTRELSGLTAGTHRLEWNGRTADGRSAPPGVYFARLSAAASGPAHRIVRIR